MDGARHVNEDEAVLYARLDERLRAIERDVRDIKDAQQRSRPQWPAILAAVSAAAALVISVIIAF